MRIKSLLLITFLGLASGCSNYRVAMQSISGCTNSETPPEKYVRAKRIEEGLYIEVLDYYNCAYRQSRPKFSVNDSLSTLSILSGNSDGLATACECPQVYGFTVLGDTRAVRTIEYTVNGYKIMTVDVPAD